MIAISKSTAAEGQWMGDKTELDLEAERVSFESWAAPGGFDLRRPNKAYSNTVTNYAWSGWLAARRATIQPTAGQDVLDVAQILAIKGAYARLKGVDLGELIEFAHAVRKADNPLFSVAPADAVRDARDLALDAAMAECQKRLTINFPSSINPVESCLNAIRALKTAPKEPAK